MPIHWTINHASRTVMATAKGDLSLNDVDDYLDGIARSATLSYRKLFDLSQSSPALSKEQSSTLSARIIAYSNLSAMGPVAIVAISEESYEKARLFEALTLAKRPLKIFREFEAAYRWLSAEPAETPQKPRS
jgi:hypothetical protein